MKNCFLCECKSCSNWCIDGYYGLCGEKSREMPEDGERPEEDGLEDGDEED